MKAHNYEVYTCNPATGEQGWDIKFITVFAESGEDARQVLKTVPNFDCIILHNYSIDIPDGSLEAEMYASGVNHFEPPLDKIYN